MKKKPCLWSLLCLTLVFSGCATHRINQFKIFADAGKTYTEAMFNLTEEAGRVAIDADSEVLIESRVSLSVEDRKKHYSDHTQALKDFLVVLRELRSHTMLLKKYFTVLSEMAESNAPSNIGEEATDVVVALRKMSPQLEDANIGDAPVKDFIGSGVPIAVARFKQRDLENELRKNAETIERELELQNALLSALIPEVRADLETILKFKVLRDVERPFTSEEELPRGWKDNRREALTAYVTMASLENASRAARELKSSFIALVENKIELSDFDDLIADISSMLDLIELARNSSDDERE